MLFYAYSEVVQENPAPFGQYVLYLKQVELR